MTLAQSAEAELKSDPLRDTELESTRCLLPPVGTHVYSAPVLDPAQLNSAVDLLLYVGSDADVYVRNRVALFAQLASEPCFDTLRTKEQLGYIVQSVARNSIGFVGFSVIVQSEKDASYIDDRIENWLVAFRKHLEELSDAEFLKQRQSLINRKREDHKNMSQEYVLRDSD